MIVINPDVISNNREKLLNFIIKENIGRVIEGVVNDRYIPHDAFLAAVKDCFGENTGALIEDFFRNNCIINHTDDWLKNNPYCQNITVPEAKRGSICYTSRERSYFPNQIMSVDIPRINKTTGEPMFTFGYSSKSVGIPSVSVVHSRNPWMTIVPYEINTANKFIREADGNVLICGCGLGYVAYMVARKENVSSVTILDINSDMIALFKEHILPQMDESISSKIKIIQCNAIEHMVTEDLSGYDHINMDLWYGTTDMLYYYLIGLILEEKYKDVKFSYWIEKALLLCIRSALIQNIINSKIYNGKYGNFLVVAECLIRCLDITIQNSDQLEDFLSFETIRANLKKLAQNRLDIVDVIGSIGNEEARVSIDQLNRASLHQN